MVLLPPPGTSLACPVGAYLLAIHDNLCKGLSSRLGQYFFQQTDRSLNRQIKQWRMLQPSIQHIHKLLRNHYTGGKAEVHNLTRSLQPQGFVSKLESKRSRSHCLRYQKQDYFKAQLQDADYLTFHVRFGRHEDVAERGGVHKESSALFGAKRDRHGA